MSCKHFYGPLEPPVRRASRLRTLHASTSRKDSLANIEATGEFCWNLASMALAGPMNLSSTPGPAHIDEFAIAGVTAIPGRLVAAPRVLESPVNFECRLSQLVQLQRADGDPVETWLTLGEVVAVHIDQALIRDGVYQTAEARPILRAGGRGDYVGVTPQAMFQMLRPGWPIA